MYYIKKSIDIDFAHHVHGHSGPCINIHGHTWKFELCLGAQDLDKEGFVMDFKALKHGILEPVHQMLDHGLAIFHETAYRRVENPSEMTTNIPFLDALAVMSREMVRTRIDVHGEGCAFKNRWYIHRTLIDNLVGSAQPDHAEWSKPDVSLNGAYDVEVGGTKLIVFPVPPTSERLAKWLFDLAVQKLEGTKIEVLEASIYETLHPVESVASFCRH